MALDVTKSLELQQSLTHSLFVDTPFQAYAILDGASNPALLDHLYGDQPEFACLYRGELEPDIAECAPYLAKLEAESPFTQWITGNGWGDHWGIFALADCDFRTMHHHLRKLNMVYDADSNRSLLFRYYDPRVLNLFLPTCDQAQQTEFYGPVQAYFAETEAGGLAKFTRDETTAVTDKQ